MNRACPFCGGNKIKIDYKTSHKRVNMQRCNALTGSIRCNICHSRGPTVTKVYESVGSSFSECLKVLEEEALNLWNKRI